jgi:hypothetical protein
VASTFGFRVGGSNLDSNNFLHGDLKVSSFAASSVPEPNSVVLLVGMFAALAGFAALRRRLA